MAADNQRDSDLQLVHAHVNQLHEHFDSVQIFCTKANSDKEGGTISINVGAGDWFARYGKARAWVLREEQSFRNEVSPEDNQ